MSGITLTTDERTALEEWKACQEYFAARYKRDQSRAALIVPLVDKLLTLPSAPVHERWLVLFTLDDLRELRTHFHDEPGWSKGHCAFCGVLVFHRGDQRIFEGAKTVCKSCADKRA